MEKICYFFQLPHKEITLKNKLLRPNEVFVITFKIPINRLWEFNATKIATANNPTAIKGGEYSVQLQLGFPYNKKSSTTLESNKLDFVIANTEH